MEKYEKLLNMLMDFNDDIRFAAICDKNGEILWNTKRNNVKPLVPMADTKKNSSKSIKCLG